MLILLRHGETEFNRAGRWQGQIDSPLTEKGRSQARTAAERLKEMPVDTILASPLGRALDTANIVAAPLGLDVRTDERLMEVGSGFCEGLTHEQIEARWPGFIAWRAMDKWNRAPEGGETYGAARERLLAFADHHDLRTSIGSTERAFLIVGHSRSLSIMAGALLGWPDQQVVDTYPPNATPLLVREQELVSL